MLVNSIRHYYAFFLVVKKGFVLFFKLVFVYESC